MSTATLPETIKTSRCPEDVLYEVMDGERVEVLPMGALASILANHLAFYLNRHAWPTKLGEAFVEVLFHLDLPINRDRRPDVAFVSTERWPKDRKLKVAVNAWDVVPNIAAEFVNPSDRIEDLLDKIDEYFRAGVQLVWVVHPAQQLIYIYESLTSIRVLKRGDILDGGTVLPQLQLPVSELFGEA